MRKVRASLAALITVCGLLWIGMMVVTADGRGLEITLSDTSLRKGEETEMTAALEGYGDLEKGVNAVMGTLEYDRDIFAEIREKDFEGAEEGVRRYITEDTVCTQENDVIFTAALRLYKESGNKEMEKKIDDVLEQYDKKLGEYLMGMDEEDFDFMDDELAFN